MRLTLPPEEHMASGHLACQGCGGALAMRYALKALGPRTIVDVPACCWSVIAGPFPYSALRVPLYHTAFEAAASVASGIRAAANVSAAGIAADPAWFDAGVVQMANEPMRGLTRRS